MSSGSILSLGLGEFSDINHVVTLGYGAGIGIAAATPPVSVDDPVRARRPTIDFVIGAGVYKPPIVAHEPHHHKPVISDVNELKEMMEIYERWRKAA
jgi:hypothetical protein